jgi:hypothetical protein
MSDINWDDRFEVINAINKIDNYEELINCRHKINKNLLNDYDFGIEFVKKYPNGLKKLSKELQNNYNIVMTAVTNGGCLFSLAYASDELKNNYNIVMTAVKKDGEALQWASKELRNNFDIVIKAVINNGKALQWASDELKNNHNIVIASIKKNADAFKYASKEMHNNLSILTIAVKKNKDLIKYAGDKILNNKEEIIWIYNNLNKEILKFANEEMQRQIIVQFIKNDDEILRYVSNEILEDKDFMLELIKINYDAMAHIARRYFRLYCNECYLDI